MIEEIKKTRVQIDGLYQLTKELRPLSIRVHNYEENTFSIVDSAGGSKETGEAVKSLLLAKAWLGKWLGELGNETPYSTGKKTVEDIEPTADTKEVREQGIDFEFIIKDGEPVYWKDLAHIEKVDYLRGEIQEIIDKLRAPDFATDFNTRESAIARTNSYNHLCESKMWLGFEFNRIKENGK